MTVNWSRSLDGTFWRYYSAGREYSVRCDLHGWIDIDTHSPDYGIPVMALGQLVFASTCAPLIREIDVLRSDDAGEHWTKLRNVKCWHPLTPFPERYR